MASLFSEHGLVALKSLTVSSSVMIFDLDGTLAPLVARPADAKISLQTLERLEALNHIWPVAVISGRAVKDARKRLGFTPRYLFGNHGAERWGIANTNDERRALDPCRNELRRYSYQLNKMNIGVEDKDLSLALHYRQALHPCNARRWLDSIVGKLGTKINASHGQSVLNITPADAPDKGDALLEIMRECDATKVLFIGDDLNDEPAFRKAPGDAITIRIGMPETQTLARFRLSFQSQVDDMLALLLKLKR